MINLIVLIFISLFSISPIPKSEIVNGTVIFYYSKKIPNSDCFINPPDMYCLDSIRFYKDDSIYAVNGEPTQNEYFIYDPEFRLSKPIIPFRQLKLFCLNPMENHIHKGGEIYEREGDSSILFIGFNVEGYAYHIIPEYNSKKNDSLLSDLKKSYDALFLNDGCESCQYFVNDNEYYIFSDVIKTTTLSKMQCEKFRLKKSKKTEFWRYGLW